MKVKKKRISHARKLSDETIKDIKLMLLYSGLKGCEIARYNAIPQSRVSEIKRCDIHADIDID